MLSILVGHCYFLRFDRKQWERAKPYPPLATLQTASSLRCNRQADSEDGDGEETDGEARRRQG